MKSLCGASAGDGSAGIGMKLRKKFEPKVTKARPRRTEAMVGMSLGKGQM
jgi:hypothetical protein